MLATLTSKGQVTLPNEIRKKLDLHSGDKLDFVLCKNGVLEVVPLKQPASKLRGMLPKPEKAVSLEDMDRAVQEGASSLCSA